ncbi:hypothetical protein CDCA_CDCA01G0312 [Cyanidium caldarium]|uniref:Nudix hydrolase domain-containing protein n=1 Tax=Cyanidium caldarium TaxID=2771 RepID=A0AAV9IPU3_CYACA|nr:hypothetical protein CDCA_CDCA01G0312 [Cyanidium caldarium]
MALADSAPDFDRPPPPGYRERAGVFALTADGQGVLVITSRSDAGPRGGGGQAISPERYILPAGGVEPGESREQAAWREALEEAGALVTILAPLVRHCPEPQSAVGKPTAAEGVKREARRLSVTYWYRARIERLVDAAGGEWPEASLRRRALISLGDGDDATAPSRLQRALSWRPDATAALQAYLAWRMTPPTVPNGDIREVDTTSKGDEGESRRAGST